MKKNQSRRTESISQQTHAIRLEFKHPTAAAISIAGTFNDWRPEATFMVAVGEGRWLKELVLPAGRYEYLFVADGEWMPDPQAKETVPNQFGGLNSVLHVANGAAKSAAKGLPNSRPE